MRCEESITSSAHVTADEFGQSLFVLARDPATFNQFYNTSVSHTLEVLGFTKDYNRPLVRSARWTDSHLIRGAGDVPGQRLRVPAAAALNRSPPCNAASHSRYFVP